MIVAVGCDHGGFQLKQELLAWLEKQGTEYRDLGCYNDNACDYPDYARKVAEAVVNGECDRGILICGTGIGMSIAANKVKGIRAAVCGDCFSAQATREHNDANVLCIGARVTGPALVLKIAEVFLTTSFSGDERHVRRITRIEE